MSRFPRRLAAVSLAAACAVAIAPAGAMAAKPKVPVKRTLSACLNQTSGKVRVAGRTGCQPLVEQRVAMRVVPRGKAGAKKQGVTNGIVVCVGKYYGAIRAEKDGCSSAETRMVISIIGPKGPAGATGPAGADGANGANGANGRDGATGPAGPAGGSGGGSVPSGAVPGMTEINGYLVGPNANLMIAQLPGANLSNLDLRQINFQGANLKGADLRSSNLRGVVFGQAGGVPTDLQDANLSGVVLTNAYMGPVNVNRASNFDGATFTGMRGDFPSLFTAGAGYAPSLRGADFRNWMYAGNTAYFGAVDLTEAQFGGFQKADITFAGSNLSGAQLAGMVWTRNDQNIFVGGLLKGTDLIGTPASLPTDVRLVNRQFIGPWTRAAGSFRNADLHGIDLTGARLEGDFRFANLRGANLTDAISGDARPDLAGTDLTGVTVSETQLCLSGQAPSALPANWSVAGSCLIGPGALLTSQTDLGSADLSSVNMNGIHSTCCALWTGTGLPPGVVAISDGGTRKMFFSPTISHRGAHVPATAYFVGADMGTKSADLRDTSFYGSSYARQFDLSRTTWGSANVTGGNLQFSGAKLAGASFSGVDMGAVGGVTVGLWNHFNDWSDVVLTGSNLHLRVDPSASDPQINMTGAQANGSQWSPPGGQGSDYRVTIPADLHNASLRGATFRQVTGGYTSSTTSYRLDFTNADLTDASFTDSDLNGTRGLTSATLTGVTWTNVTCPDGELSTAHGNTCVGHLVP